MNSLHLSSAGGPRGVESINLGAPLWPVLAAPWASFLKPILFSTTPGGHVATSGFGSGEGRLISLTWLLSVLLA